MNSLLLDYQLSTLVERVFVGQVTTRSMNAAKLTEIRSGFKHRAVHKRQVVRESGTFVNYERSKITNVQKSQMFENHERSKVMNVQKSRTFKNHERS